MSIVELLLETARADTDLLIKNDALGDSFSIPRDVDFLFIAPNKAKAEVVRSFVDDNRYGVQRVEEVDDYYHVVVVVNMPTEQHVVCAVSGLMACISQLFGVKYDGWGCELKRAS